MNLLCLPRKSVSSWEDKSKSPYFQPRLLATKQTSFQLIKAYRNLSLMFARRQISTSFIAGDRVQMYTGKKKEKRKKLVEMIFLSGFFFWPLPSTPSPATTQANKSSSLHIMYMQLVSLAALP